MRHIRRVCYVCTLRCEALCLRACGLATVWSQGGIRVTSGRPAALPAHPAPAARVHDTHTRAVKSRGACGGVVSRERTAVGATADASGGRWGPRGRRRRPRWACTRPVSRVGRSTSRRERDS